MVSTITDRLRGFSIGAAIKAPAAVATTGANLTLSGAQTIDGVAVGTSERVLVKDQTDAKENGVWVSDSSTWIRATDVDGNDDIKAGTLVYVDRGTQNGNSFWVFQASSTSLSFEVGTNNIALTQVTVALAGVGTFGATLVTAVSASSARSILELGILSTQDSVGTTEIDDKSISMVKMSTQTPGGIVTFSSLGEAQVISTTSSGETVISGASGMPSLFGSAIPSSTVMLFYQDTVPDGWTRVTTAALDDNAIRIDTQSTMGFTGSTGTNGFSLAFGATGVASAADAGTAPAHTHRMSANWANGGGTVNQRDIWGTQQSDQAAIDKNTESGGAGGTHSHDMDLDVKYVSMFLAKKD